MAHGIRCQRCGHQEAEHAYPKQYTGVCKYYVSPDPKAEQQIWDDERKRDGARAR